jgi:hypothetical protein
VLGSYIRPGSDDDRSMATLSLRLSFAA